jgi:hypothetical protein
VLRIFDAHVHLFDCAANTHAFLVQDDPNFAAIVGDYSTLLGPMLTEYFGRQRLAEQDAAAKAASILPKTTNQVVREVSGK